MTARSVQQGWSLDYFMWIFTRISGIALVGLAIVGLAGALALGARTQLDFISLMRWTFVPNPNHVINSGIPDVALGWANGFWQIMQILIVFLGATHGFNGLRAVIDDFMCKSIWCPLVRGLLILAWTFVLIVALYVILGA